MRVVICINPKVPLEYYKTANEYADRTIGFDLVGDPDDAANLAAHLRELVAALEAPAIQFDETS